MTAHRKAHAEALAALRRLLGAPPPPGVAMLDAGDLTRLCEAIGEARARNLDALTLAIDEALLQVPSLIRGPVARIVLR